MLEQNQKSKLERWCLIGKMHAQTSNIKHMLKKMKSTEVFLKVDFPFMSPTSTLGLMGMLTGLAVYTGAYYACRRPRKGETVVVTGAAGAVGSIASQ